MSQNRKNNHYHYSEKFSDRRRRAKKLPLPRRTVFFAVLMLLVFGVVTATFSANNTAPSTVKGGAMIVRIRNPKISEEEAFTISQKEILASTGANVDLAKTGAQTYYYSGQGNGTNWTKKAMTVSADGFYEYYYVSSTTTHQFKIGTSSNQYAYNYSYVTSGFNSTNVSQIGDYGKDNCYCWKGSAHYIIVYYPNTLINTGSNPVICASTSLPDNTPTVQLGEYFTNSSTASYTSMTNNSGTYTCTKSLTGNLTRAYFLVVTYRSDIVHYYKNPDEGTMVYSNCSNWTFTNNNKADTKLTTVITGDYTFTFDLSGQKLSVTYPKYKVSVSKNPAAASSGSMTPSTTTDVSIGSGITISAPTPATGYEWVNWTVTGGTVKTGSYTGTSMSSSTTRTNLTVYPYGTTQNVTLRANYKLSEYAITYKADASPATAAAGTITNPASNSVPTGDKKTHGQSYTITSNKFTRSGYTQVGWSTTANRTSASGNGYYAFGATYSTDAALTLYPVWQLNAPTKAAGNASAPEINSTGSMTVGSTPVDLTLQVSSASVDATRTYTCQITGPSGNNASVGTNPGNSSDFMKFTADIPGTYTVSITVTDVSHTNVTNADNTASAVTNTATITVAPEVPVFDVTFYGTYYDSQRPGRDGSTTENAYIILLGNRYYFSANIDSTYLNNHPTSDYTYEWAWNADFASNHMIDTGGANLTSITFKDVGTDTEPNYCLISYDSTHTYDPENGDPDPRSIVEESDGGIMHSVNLYCRVTRNGASTDSPLKQRWYFIQPLIKSFQYEPMQKIFNMNDQTVSLAAEYSVEDNPAYTTQLYFSSNNSNTQTDWSLAASDTGFIHSFANAIKSFLYPVGPKYFYMLMSGVNSQGEPIVSRSEKIHTTVGTVDSTASRTLYFTNSVANTSLKNYQVMCYYIDVSGRLRYQKAQDLKLSDNTVVDTEVVDTNGDDGRYYRVMIPADAQAVRFGFLSSDFEGIFYYGTPTLSGGTISGFTAPSYYGYTDQIELTDSIRVITANSASSDANSLQCFTCTTGAY